ncbi:MAG: tail fiber domain-containing protein [Thermoflexales bacterium]|nr:tail fiber domain-containing protein [Thermoflexales bacterium]
MKTKLTLILFLAAVAALAVAVGLTRAQEPQPPGGVGIQAALGTAFTYQGQLKQGGNPVSATCDFQFSLWDSLSNSTGQIGSTQTRTGVQVSNGLFTIPDLDFGAGAFQGDARWLQIAVKCTGDSTYTTLTPRQALTAAPYALFSKAAPWNGLTGVPSGFADGVDDTGWSLTGNSGTTPGTHFLGTTDNQALEFKVNGQRVLRLEPNGFSPNVIGGYSGNSVGAGVGGATIGGGGYLASPNSVTGWYGTVGGGWSNTAGGNQATIAGGRGNTTNGDDATVGGGASNNASGQAATVAGGNINTASGYVATVSGGGNNAALSDGATVGGGMNNTVRGDNSVIGGGAYNTISVTMAAIGGGWSNLITGTASYATIGGGYDNLITGTASMGTIGGGDANTVSSWNATVGGGIHNTASGDSSTIGGGGWNIASGIATTVGGGNNNQAWASYATIAGGSDITVTANGQYAAVGGGSNNTASNQYATIGGGTGNIASGVVATIGGGASNTASGSPATVGGGRNNTASGLDATVSGGNYNAASGVAATIPGGYQNTAAGAFSFAAGLRAKANNQGCFVWGDATNADVSCNDNNRWIARASGGVYFYTNANLTTGSYLAAGGSSWNAVSNRALKENFAPVDTRQLLERLAAIEITTWNYRSQDPSIRHIGPMADDFNALVDGLGGEGKDYINSLDADGVSLAAIQGLYGLVQEKDARIAELEARVAALEEQNAAQQAQLDALEARVAALERRAGSGSVSARDFPAPWLALGGLAMLGAVVYWRRKNGGRR